jgi:glycosyltransferase involved in cell wall biosynthesis
MRVLQVYHNLISGIGGHELVVRRLCERLVERGWRVLVVVPSHKNVATMYTTANGLLLIGLPTYKFHNRVHILKLRALREVVRAIKSAKVIHIHSPDDPFTFLIGFLSKLSGKKVVTTVLAYADDLKHHEIIKRFYGLITAILQTLAACFSDKIHVESAYDFAKMHTFKGKLVFIPPGINDKFFDEKVNFAKKVNSHPSILYIGRIHRAKGIDILLKAINIIVSNKIYVKLNIVGPDDGYLKTLQSLIKELKMENYVEFLGEVSEEEKISLIDLSDIVVIPSLSDIVEAYSLVASEAWARGKWVVSSNVGALKYRVKDGVNGYLCKPGDPIDLADKILKLFKNSGVLRPPFDVWSLGRTVDAFEKLYMKVLNSH